MARATDALLAGMSMSSRAVILLSRTALNGVTLVNARVTFPH